MQNARYDDELRAWGKVGRMGRIASSADLPGDQDRSDRHFKGGYV